MLKKMFLVVTMLLFAVSSSAQGLSFIKLLPPKTDNQKSLAQTLKERKSTRTFSKKQLPIQTIFNLLTLTSYYAAQRLSTVIRGLADKEELAKSMKLRDTQKIILAQSVGYPK
jgi:hypothetical protein